MQLHYHPGERILRDFVKYIYLTATTMSEEWCVEQLAKLQIKEQRLSTLNEIKTHLTNLPSNETTISSKLLTLLDSMDDCRERYAHYSIY